MGKNKNIKEMDQESKKIYVIATMEKLSEDPTGFPDFGSTAVPGYFFSKEAAIRYVKENRCDMFECSYLYAVVEEVGEGLYHSAGKGQRWWFKYNLEEEWYEEIPEPEFLKNISGFTIG